jgi:hypothetical protein
MSVENQNSSSWGKGVHKIQYVSVIQYKFFMESMKLLMYVGNYHKRLLVDYIGGKKEYFHCVIGICI